MHEDGEWFGIVRWCNEDIEEALLQHGIQVTQDNIDEIRVRCERHWFTDAMIEAGWNAMYNEILEARLEGKIQ